MSPTSHLYIDDSDDNNDSDDSDDNDDESGSDTVSLVFSISFD